MTLPVRLAALVVALLPVTAVAQSVGPGSALIEAARIGDVAGVEAALAGGADPEAADTNGATALFWAAHAGFADVVRVLAEAGARLDPEGTIRVVGTGAYGSPLAAAAAGGHVAVLEALTERGVDLDQPGWDSEAGERAGWTAAQWAAFAGHADIVGALLAGGGHPLWHAPQTEPPFQIAYNFGQDGSAAVFAGLAGEWSVLRGFVGDFSAAETGRLSAGAALEQAGLGWIGAALTGDQSMVRRLDDLVHADSLTAAAARLRRLGQYEAARPLYERAREIIETAAGPDHPTTGARLNDLAGLLRIQGDYVGARPLYERALGIREVALGPDHPATATSLNDLAALHYAQGDYASARPLFERALVLKERALGLDDLDTVVSLNNLAVVLQALGEFSGAQPLYERALAVREAERGGDHPETAASLNNLGVLLYAQGDYAAARPLYERSLAIREAALGPDHPDTAVSLRNLARLIQTQGEYAPTRPLLERALAATESAFGPDHPETATSLSTLGSLLRELGEYDGARSHHERALSIREAVLGPGHPDTAGSLDDLGRLFQDQGEYERAGPLYERALAILEATLGRDHPETAASLSTLGSLLVAQGHYAAARPYYEQVLAVREAALGPGHPDTAMSQTNLASLLQVQGEYVFAQPLYERALATTEAVHGPDHPATAMCLNNLGVLLQAQGDYDSARHHFERVLAIREAALGPGHPLTATSLSTLARLLQGQGEYGAARPLYDRALAITESAQGADHPDTAVALNNLGILLQAQGDRDSARPHFERALAIREAALGPSHPTTAVSLSNLAELLHAQGDDAEARRLFERTLSICEETLGSSHPFMATILNNLGVLLYAEGDYSSAGPLYTRALAIREAALGRGHISTAVTLNNLGVLLYEQGDYTAALPLYERSLAIRESALGPDHPDAVEILINIARLYLAQGDYTSARPHVDRAVVGIGRFIVDVLPTLAPSEQRLFVSDHLPRQQGLLLTAVTWPSEEPVSGAYAALAGWKGLLFQGLRRQAALRRLASSSSDPDVRRVAIRIGILGTQIAQSYTQGAEADSLVAAKEALERQLAVILPEGARLRDIWDVEVVHGRDGATGRDGRGHLRALQAALGASGALVDIYRYVRSPSPRAPGGIRYVAVVVPGSSNGAPVQFVDLGEADGIEGLLSRWRLGIAGGGDAGEETDSLLDVLWAPIRDALPLGVERVWVSPGEQLARLPWNWLVGEDSQAAHLEVRHTPSARALLRGLAADRGATEGGVVLLAGAVEYGGEGRPFYALDSTGPEVQTVMAYAEAGGHAPRLMIGVEPTPQSFKTAAPGTRYVHLATHGYFGGSSEADLGDVLGPTRGGSVFSFDKDPTADAERAALAVRNPLVESGVALAGANDSPAGRLAAEEIVDIDLTGVRLVTLSACETGLGTEVSGQGVMGLRSAVLAAGAEAVLVALWKVPDAAAAELMGRFYRGLWAEGLDPAAALQAAQRSMRAEGRPPVEWAAWVLDGGR